MNEEKSRLQSVFFSPNIHLVVILNAQNKKKQTEWMSKGVRAYICACLYLICPLSLHFRPSYHGIVCLLNIIIINKHGKLSQYLQLLFETTWCRVRSV